MAQNIAPFSISAPGFMGLDKADSPVDLSPNFALEANNCVIDKYGRITSRKGWVKQHAVNADIGSNPFTCIGELVTSNGTKTILATGNGKLFKLASGILTTLTYGGGGVAPTINANNWKFCQLNGVAMFWQRAYDPLIYDPAVSTTTFRRLSEKSGSTGTIYQCNEAISAYGRVWAVDNGADRQTVVWSDLLTPHIWTGGTSGSLDVRNVWPVGGDSIVAMAAHNNLLFLFGKRQTLIYENVENPAEMRLKDSIIGVGCIARDSVQVVGEDILFLSGDGVRSIMRTIQEKSSPMKTISVNVHQDIIDLIAVNDGDTIKSGYSRSNTFYALTFPLNDVTYCFDTRSTLENGALRTTTWSQITPSAYCDTADGITYLGQDGYIGTYSGYIDNTSSYRMSYFTTWIDFGNPIQTSILKKAILTVIGLSNQSVVFKWGYDFVPSYFSETQVLSGISAPSEYGTAEYGVSEYSGDVTVRTIRVQGSSSGKVLQFGMEALINSYQVSIQKIELYCKNGRLQ